MGVVRVIRIMNSAIRPRPAMQLVPPAPPVAEAPDASRDARAVQRLSLFLVSGCLAYAVVRYVVLGTVEPAQLPLFVLNKALAATGLALLSLCLAWSPLMRVLPGTTSGMRKWLGVAGFGFSAVHSVATLAMLNPIYYAKLFGDTGRLSLTGELTLLLGVASMAALILPAMTSFAGIRQAMPPAEWKRMQKLALVALVTGALHVVVMGMPTWLKPETWPGGLPPITLWAAFAAALALTLRAVARS